MKLKTRKIVSLVLAAAMVVSSAVFTNADVSVGTAVSADLAADTYSETAAGTYAAGDVVYTSANMTVKAADALTVKAVNDVYAIYGAGSSDVRFSSSDGDTIRPIYSIEVLKAGTLTVTADVNSTKKIVLGKSDESYTVLNSYTNEGTDKAEGYELSAAVEAGTYYFGGVGTNVYTYSVSLDDGSSSEESSEATTEAASEETTAEATSEAATEAEETTEETTSSSTESDCPYTLVVDRDVTAGMAEGDTLTASVVTLTAMQALTLEVIGASEIGDYTYYNALKSSGVNTSVVVDSASAANYRIHSSLTASADCTVTIATKVPSGKKVSIATLNEDGSYTSLFYSDGSTAAYADGTAGTVGSTELTFDLTSGETIYLLGNGTNLEIYAINVVTGSSEESSEATTEAASEETTAEATTEAASEETTAEATTEASSSTGSSDTYSETAAGSYALGDVVYTSANMTVNAADALTVKAVNDVYAIYGAGTSDVRFTSSDGDTIRPIYLIEVETAGTLTITADVNSGKTIVLGKSDDANTVVASYTNDGSDKAEGYELSAEVEPGIYYFGGVGTNVYTYSVTLTTDSGSSSEETVGTANLTADAVTIDTVGGTATVSINLTDITTEVNNLTFYVTYDPSIAKVTAAEMLAADKTLSTATDDLNIAITSAHATADSHYEGLAGSTAFEAGVIKAAFVTGTYSDTSATSLFAFSDDTTVLTLTFEGVAVGTTPVTLEVVDCNTLPDTTNTVDSKAITVTATDGSVTVGEPVVVYTDDSVTVKTVDGEVTETEIEGVGTLYTSGAFMLSASAAGSVSVTADVADVTITAYDEATDTYTAVTFETSTDESTGYTTYTFAAEEGVTYFLTRTEGDFSVFVASEETSTETSTEASTEASTDASTETTTEAVEGDAILTVGSATSARTVGSTSTINITLGDLKNVEVNNGTYWVTYDPTYVQVTEVKSLAADKSLTNDLTSYVTTPLVSANKTNDDLYTDEDITAGLTPAQAGKIKLAFALVTGDGDTTELTFDALTAETIIATLTFTVVGDVDVPTSVKSVALNPTVIDFADVPVLDGNYPDIEVGAVSGEITFTDEEESSSEATSEDQSSSEESSSEATSEEESSSEESSSEATSEEESSSEETSSEETSGEETSSEETSSEATTATESTTSTDATTETTTKKSSSGGGGGGSSYSGTTTTTEATTEATTESEAADTEEPAAATDETSKSGVASFAEVDGYHFAYMVGYTDGTFGPNKNITRAEVAAVFARLTAGTIQVNGGTATYTDILGSEWYADYVAYLEDLSVLEGYTDGSFAPTRPITRAEFASILAKYVGTASASYADFSDVEGHWAEANIAGAVKAGWMSGYNDGTFKPDAYITRAEVVSAVNRATGRVFDTTVDTDSIVTFSDVAAGAWYETAVYEAVNSHWFTGSETWYLTEDAYNEATAVEEEEEEAETEEEIDYVSALTALADVTLTEEQEAVLTENADVISAAAAAVEAGGELDDETIASLQAIYDSVMALAETEE